MSAQPDHSTLRIDGHIVPKARPSFDGRSGRAFHKADYKAWLEDAGWQVAGQRKGRRHTGDVVVKIVVAGGKAAIRIEDAETERRPTGVRGDIDNIAGSVLDALQLGGIIENDHQATRLEVYFWDDDLEAIHSTHTEDRP